MPAIEAADILQGFQSAMDLYLLAKRNKEEAHARALKAGYTEAELATIRDDALIAFMEPLRDPLDEPTLTEQALDVDVDVDAPTESGP